MNLVKSMEEALNKMYSTKEEKNGEKIKLSKKKEKVDLNPKIEITRSVVPLLHVLCRCNTIKWYPRNL